MTQPTALTADQSAQGSASGSISDPQRFLIPVDPESILFDPNISKLRRRSGNSAQELTIPELAKSIYEEGQDNPCIVRPGDEGLLLVAGSRRLEAVKYIRSNPEFDSPDHLVWVEVQELDEKQAKKKAIAENLQREGFTKIELAWIIKDLRAECRPEINCTEYVADYLGVSPATVTQTERLLDLAPEEQDQVQSGQMRVEVALELLNTRPEVRDEVKAKAQEIADQKAEEKRVKEEEKERKREEKEQARKAKEKSKEKAKTPANPYDESDKPEPVAEPTLEPKAASAPTPKPEPKPAKILRQHVVQAQRETPGSVDKPKAPKMADAISLIEQWTGPAYPKVLAKFAGAFCDWGHGKLKSGDKGLEGAWDDVADALGKRPEKKEKAEAAKPVSTVSKTAKPPVSKAAKPTTSTEGKKKEKTATKTGKPAKKAVAGKKAKEK